MKELLEAINIFLNYGDPEYPTTCGHDGLYIIIDPEIVSPKDLERLKTLGFEPNAFRGYFVSSKFGKP